MSFSMLTGTGDGHLCLSVIRENSFFFFFVEGEPVSQVLRNADIYLAIRICGVVPS